MLLNDLQCSLISHDSHLVTSQEKQKKLLAETRLDGKLRVHEGWQVLSVVLCWSVLMNLHWFYFWLMKQEATQQRMKRLFNKHIHRLRLTERLSMFIPWKDEMFQASIANGLRKRVGTSFFKFLCLFSCFRCNSIDEHIDFFVRLYFMCTFEYHYRMCMFVYTVCQFRCTCVCVNSKHVQVSTFYKHLATWDYMNLHESTYSM